MNKRFKGVMSAFLTPFDRNGDVLPCAVDAMVEYQISKGIMGFYVAGSTGLGMIMSMEQRKQIAELVVEAVNNRVPVIVHVGSADTMESVELAKHASKCGADAVSAVPPYYFKYDMDTVGQYYKDIASASDLPLLLYNIPALTGVALGRNFLENLMSVKNVIGVKYTDTNMETVGMLKQWNNGAMTVFTGYDGMLACGLAMGADGGIGSYYNVMPKAFTKVYRYAEKGDIKAAFEEQKQINFYINIVRKYISTASMPALYAIMRAIGVESGDVKLPFKPICEEKENAMILELKREGFFDYIV